MRSPVRLITTLSLALSAIATAVVLAHPVAPRPPTATVSTSDITARIVASAQALLATLDDAARAKVQFPFEGAQKSRWSNLPSGIFRREGLRIGDLTPPQRAAVNDLLAVALSRDGYR